MGREGGGRVAARISEISFTKYPESEFFSIKNPNLTKKILTGGRGGGGGG